MGHGSINKHTILPHLTRGCGHASVYMLMYMDPLQHTHSYTTLFCFGFVDIWSGQESGLL